jgi:putative ABC transport system ATP-binding protein
VVPVQLPRPERLLILAVLRRRIRPLSLGCTASIVHQACEALVPLAIGLAIDHAVDNRPVIDSVITVGVVLVLFTVLATGGGSAFWILTGAAQREAHHLRVRAIGRVMTDPQAGSGRTAGELMSILTSDTAAIAEILRALANAVSGVAGLVVTAVVLLRIDLALGLGLVLVVPALMVVIDRIGPWLEAKVQAQQQAGGLAAAFAAEVVQALRPLRGFGGLGEASRRYRGVSRRSLDTALEAASAKAVVTGVGLVATGGVVIGTAAAAGEMAFSGRISVGEFVTVVAMASFVAEPVLRIASAVQQIAVSRASAARVAPLLTADEPAPGELRTFLRDKGGASARVGPLRLRDVTVGPVVGLDFELGAGEMLGIVTTDPSAADAVTSLLAGLRPAESGQVTIGELALDAPAVRRQLLVEPHAAHLLGGTLAEVMDTGRNTGLVEAALVATQVDGVQTELQDGGSNLSGGQRQRVALARALAADPPVLVLRDPLTAVDAVTEADVAAHLHVLRHERGLSTVVISTSPPLLAACERVLFLDGLEPAVSGTHAELIAARPGYAAAVLR